MDNVDRKIVDILEEDGRASFTDIAEEIGVSEGTVRNRVEKMQDNGTIRKFTVELSRDNSVEAFTMVRVDTGSSIGEILEEFPEDIEVNELAGEYDLIVKISRENSGQINEAVDSIRAVDGVNSTKTYMVLG